MDIILERLDDIESELKRLALWDSAQPSAEALASQLPFCVDTLSFPQWLQHIYLPHLRELIDQQQALPKGAQVTPMAQEYFKPLGLDTKALILHLAVVDHQLQ